VGRAGAGGMMTRTTGRAGQQPARLAVTVSGGCSIRSCSGCRPGPAGIPEQDRHARSRSGRLAFRFFVLLFPRP
jgi:hypothetical protein